MKHTCLTYYLVKYNVDNFDLRDFCARLKLNYEEIKRFTTPGTIEIGRYDIYEEDINNMVRVTLKELFGKEEALLELKARYELEYFLERVPLILLDSDEQFPNLSLDEDIVEFMYKTRTIDDLDYFIIDKKRN